MAAAMAILVLLCVCVCVCVCCIVFPVLWLVAKTIAI